MQPWGSLLIIATLITVHISIKHWRFLDGPRSSTWLSISAGTALAYVFAYLLPKLASIDLKIADSGWQPVIYFMHNQAYLLALAGLLTFFTLDKPSATVPPANRLVISRRLVLQILAYGFYNLQLGYLASELPEPDLLPYLLIASLLGLHLMGVDHFILHRNPIGYQRLLRWVYAGAVIAGWGIGQLTSALEYVVVLCSAFVAGGIIINAIRDELPGHHHSTPGAFYISVFVACLVILLVQYWRTH